MTIEPTHLAVGAALAARHDLAILLNGEERPPPETNGHRSGANLAVGAVFALRDGMLGASKIARRSGRVLLAPAAVVAGSPVLAPGRRTAQRLLDRLETRGRQEAAASLAQSAALVEALTRRVDRSPLVTGMIEDIVSGLLEPIVDEAIPIVLERLAAEHEAVRAIVQSQSLGMADQLVQRTRASAVQGDELVDRVTRRVFRRRPAKPEEDPLATPEPPPSTMLAAT